MYIRELTTSKLKEQITMARLCSALH